MGKEIHEITEFHDMPNVFADRFEAGRIVGSMLNKEFYGIKEGIVLAIPSGGVPVGIKVSEALKLPLDLVLARKLQIPGNTEAGYGAIAIDGTTFFNRTILSQLNLSEEQIESEMTRVLGELEKRNSLFREGSPTPDLTGKRVILVDDGLASGYTMLASVHMARNSMAAEAVIAVPTAPERTIDFISTHVDKIYCANIRTGPFFAVADAYQTWYDLKDRDVRDFLQASYSAQKR